MDIAPFKELIKLRCGLIFEGVGEKPLVDGLCRRIDETGAENASAYCARLRGDEHEFHELVCLLTINETYFYREPEQLHFLTDRLVPRILARRRDASPVLILSAGCSTGEEPYSLAMALREKYGDSAARLFMLAGGDIDKNALTKARAARYNEYSFRSLAPELRSRYFERHGRWAWNVKDEVRQQVHFHHLNLLDEHHSHGLQDFDVIFLRNVSIYFDAPTRRLIQQRLSALLKEDGYLVVGSAETLANDLGVLKLVEEDGLFYFSKQQPAILPSSPLCPLGYAGGRGAGGEGEVVRKSINYPLPSPLPLAGEGKRPAIQHKTVMDWVSPAPVTPPPASGVDTALRLTREKRHDEAMTIIARSLEQQPGKTWALLIKAHILLNRKEYAAAEEAAQQVLKIEAWSIDALVVLGLAAKWRNQAADAVKWFKQAAYANHECWPAHYYLAELYRADNELDKARRAYRVALQLLSGHPVPGDGLSVIPLGLPAAEVRFLCEHQLAKLDGACAVAAR